MCGIAGIVDLNGNLQELKSNLIKMAQMLRHRGPDDEGFFYSNPNNFSTEGGNDTPKDCYRSQLLYAPKESLNNINKAQIGLAHRRLSIIDLNPSGHQPMCNDNQNLWLVFNGEIYNYESIKSKLISFGYNFVSNSDSEVVLKAFEHWGKDCVHHFNGMWALAIYNRLEQTLFCSRDRFGVKPFYYIYHNHLFAFASEQKALLHLLKNESKINRAAAFQYLVLGTSEQNEKGLFEKILELQPSHQLELDLKRNQLKKHQYYQLKYLADWEDFSETKFQNYSAQLNHLLTESIRLRLHSDVALGTCLSGGLDSSSIVCITDKLLKENPLQQVGNRQSLFTSVFLNQKIDESNWAKIIAEKTHAKWYQVEPTPEEMIQEFEDLTYSQDIPILSSSTYAQYKVMQKVNQQGIKVTLDGQGADELFAGYDPHYTAFFYENIKNKKWRETFLNLKNIGTQFANPKYVLNVPLKHSATLLFPHFIKTNGYRKFNKEYKFISNELWTQNKEELNLLNNKFSYNLNQKLHKEFTGHQLKVLLRTGDRNSMRFSVESRVPFSDDLPLIETVFQIPSSYKIRNNQSKYLLRQAMKDLLPKAIFNRNDKQGFSTPEFLWLKTNKNYFKQYITNDLSEFIHVKPLLNKWDSTIDRLNPNNTNRLFRIIQFAAWKKVFNL
ncbi:MAG: asparagine synthase (glutamine-hydrolyzing) [Cytophagales bacterium]|nr:MAG: asparagine synthase (glutamine-hydrolyzing) [Cytophagales bacterium]